MLAAIFSSYGKRTRPDRFIPVYSLPEKETARQYARMQTSASIDRRCRIDQLPFYVSFQLCLVCFLRGLVFSQ